MCIRDSNRTVLKVLCRNRTWATNFQSHIFLIYKFNTYKTVTVSFLRTISYWYTCYLHSNCNCCHIYQWHMHIRRNTTQKTLASLRSIPLKSHMSNSLNYDPFWHSDITLREYTETKNDYKVVMFTSLSCILLSLSILTPFFKHEVIVVLYHWQQHSCKKGMLFIMSLVTGSGNHVDLSLIHI